jgi:hypothetical protein
MERHYRALLGAESHEIIMIRDARSLAEGYNRGLDQSTGDIVIFSHDDIEFLDPAHWLSRLKGHLEAFDLVGLAGTTKLISPLWVGAGPPYTFGHVGELDGRIARFRVLIFAVPGPIVPGIQALDGLFLAGFRLAVASDLPVLHSSQGNFDQKWEYYAKRFVEKHGKHFPPFRPRPFSHAVVGAQTKDELLEIMSVPGTQ